MYNSILNRCPATYIYIVISLYFTDINPTPPLEFPTEGQNLKIIQAISLIDTLTNDLSNSPVLYFSNPELNTTSNKSQEENIRITSHVHTLQINELNISKNCTRNIINSNLFSNNATSILFIFAGFLIAIMSFLTVIVLYTKKIKTKKLSVKEILVVECKEFIINNSIHQV
ncbi:uncharacterized protein LOC126893810 isoform X2 [Daktulosphaira vitifoliae]|uniref:uncharacterized protein LOC126893810 isoform X2 n=1 Tax=Daktulosphaira vitifoliae TaxID=58002 RepID=UPI0021AA2BB0|nr:uncharacterized protein LOC126893810 isoform X2 [Daktulosphaira vitifoliae]